MRKIFSAAFLCGIFVACSSTQPGEPIATESSELSVGQTLNQSVGEPANASAVVTATECSNSPGPYITFDGAVVLSGMDLKVIFTNNAKFTHVTTADTVVNVSVLPANESITIPKQPSLGGVGGNPWIYVQFVDASGNPLSGELLLGRCVQGLNPLTAATVAPWLTAFTLDNVSCSNSPGPFITFEGSLASKGLAIRLIFKNAPNGPHTYATTGDIVVVPGSLDVTIPKQPVLGGAGGNPWIYLEWTDSAGNVLSGPTLLGRCNRL